MGHQEQQYFFTPRYMQSSACTLDGSRIGKRFFRAPDVRITQRINLVVAATRAHKNLAALIAPDDARRRIVGMEAIVVNVGVIQPFLKREIGDAVEMRKMTEDFAPRVEFMQSE